MPLTDPTDRRSVESGDVTLQQRHDLQGRMTTLVAKGTDFTYFEFRYYCTMPTRSSNHMNTKQIVNQVPDETTSEEFKTESPPVKNQAAVELGRLGGMKGGAARAAKLTPEQRSEIAKKAAQSRWKSKQDEDAKRLQAFPPATKKRIGA